MLNITGCCNKNSVEKYFIKNFNETERLIKLISSIEKEYQTGLVLRKIKNGQLHVNFYTRTKPVKMSSELLDKHDVCMDCKNSIGIETEVLNDAIFINLLTTFKRLDYKVLSFRNDEEIFMGLCKKPGEKNVEIGIVYLSKDVDNKQHLVKKIDDNFYITETVVP